VTTPTAFTHGAHAGPAPLPTPVLSVDALTVDVADGRRLRRVLDRVTLEVAAGEMVAVMGPSGAGKSTLLGAACGLVVPQGGGVRLYGDQPRMVSSAWWADRRRDTIGVVHQRLNLLGGLSAVDNAALAVDLLGGSHRTARRAALAALERVGAAHVAETRAERLSVGEQQRVAIARGITGDRPLLLADEPSAALDRTSADEITRLLADLAAEGRAVLLVTHDSQQASWADRTIVLRDGCVVDQVKADTASRGR